MNKTNGSKDSPNIGFIRKSTSRKRDKGSVYIAPSLDGSDKEYVVVFERKAVYKKPSYI